MRINNAIRNFIAYGVIVSIEKGAALVLLPLYTKVFTPIEYGVLDIFSSLLVISMGLGMLQLETSLQRFYYEVNKKDKAKIVFNVIFLIILISAFFSFFIYFYSSELSLLLFNHPNYDKVIEILSFQIGIQNVIIIGLVVLRFEKRNKIFFLISVFKVLLLVSSSYFIVGVLNKSIQDLLFTHLVCQVVTFFLVLYNIKEYIMTVVDVKIQRELFKYALPQLPARIGSLTISEINKYFILSFLSLTALGIYSVALKLGSAIQLLNSTFMLWWGPFMFSLFEKRNNKAYFRSLFPIISAVVLLGVLLLTLFSTELVSWFVTKEYIESSKFLGGISLFYGLYIIKEAVDIGPKVMKKTVFISVNFLVSVLVNVISLAYLTPIFALSGVVWSLIVTNIVLVGVSWYTSNHLYRINYNIVEFVCILLPILFINYLIMNYDITFEIRFVTFITLSFLYIVVIICNYRKLANIENEK